MAVVIETTLGDITVDLFVAERPRACLNFIKLCKLKYYNFNLFHTIERDFIAQTGDPTGAGDGGESIWGVVEGSHKRFFEAESLPKIKHSVPGLLSMVSVGKFMVGSQFFITLGSDLTSLDGVHCVIGEVVEGREILRLMNLAIVDDKFRPFQDIRITHTVILDDPFSDPRGFQVPSRSPSPTEERLQNGRIGADEDIDDTAGKTIEEVQEMLAEREAKARATILEIVGDLPDADVAPPENVLFVCKLNPVTTDDDLEIIFSRFGKVKGCEVIRDKVSGDSLQYAFVEFEEQKSCEVAYFKMDNVLIDDRRIHVDFSQSVSKVQWRGKGRGFVNENEKDRKLDFNNLRDNRRGDRRNQRDRSGSPFRKSGNHSRREHRNDSYESHIRSKTKGSPKSVKKLEDHPRRNSREDSASRSQREDRRVDKQRSDFRDRSPVRKREYHARRISSQERQQSPHRPRSQQKFKHGSAAGDRYRSGNRSPDERRRRRSPRNENSPDERRRRRSPRNERKRTPDVSASKNELDRRENIGSKSKDRRQHSPNDSFSRNGNDKRRYGDDLILKEDRRDRPSGREDKLQRPESRSASAMHSKKVQSKPKKSHETSKKKKKSITSSSSSSSETESDSSSSSTSSSSSSDDRRKKPKKSKKSSNKSKKRTKKKAKSRYSSSSSD